MCAYRKYPGDRICEKDDIMEYSEDDYLMISGIQHFKFCRRQWALIHIEQQWEENVHTVVGELMHKKVHDPLLKEKRKDTITARALPVSSRELGISGECDLVEFHKCEDGIRLHGHRGLWSVYPVEYKKGKPKVSDEDKLQLAAQALCLEEMFSTTVPEGAIFYGETRRRELVGVTEELRSEVKQMFREMHEYYERKYTPKVKYSKACNSCSLKEICLPKIGKTVSVKTYMEQMLKEGEAYAGTGSDREHMGIGLMICRILCRKHGGIDLSSGGGIDQSTLAALRIFCHNLFHFNSGMSLYQFTELCNTVRLIIFNADIAFCMIKKLQHYLKTRNDLVRFFQHSPVITGQIRLALRPVYQNIFNLIRLLRRQLDMEGGSAKTSRFSTETSYRFTASSFLSSDKTEISVKGL